MSAPLLAAPTIGALPSVLPKWQGLDPNGFSTLFNAGIAVAALAALESLLSARVADGMSDVEPSKPDRELFGQGLANIASGLFGGMPATGAFARTAVNVRSGARTRVSAIVHAIVLLVGVVAAANLISRIPLAALAGVLVVTASRMIERHAIKAELAHIEKQLLKEHIAVYRMDGALFFGVAQQFLDALTQNSDVRVLILRLDRIQMIDATGAYALGQLVDDLRGKGIAVLIKGVKQAHADVLAGVGVLKELDERGHVFDDMDDAIAHARKHLTRSEHHHD